MGCCGKKPRSNDKGIKISRSPVPRRAITSYREPRTPGCEKCKWPTNKLSKFQNGKMVVYLVCSNRNCRYQRLA